MGLIEDSVAARKAHMTYGQYMAQVKPYEVPVRRFSGSLRKVPGRHPCAFCGKPVNDNRNRYCCRECYQKAKRGEANV